MEKKKPIRMCGVCRQKKERGELIKVVRKPSGEVVVDPSGKINGRSVYICYSDECIKKAEKSNLVSRSLGETDNTIYEEIRNVKRAREN